MWNSLQTQCPCHLLKSSPPGLDEFITPNSHYINVFKEPFTFSWGVFPLCKRQHNKSSFPLDSANTLADEKPVSTRIFISSWVLLCTDLKIQNVCKGCWQYFQGLTFRLVYWVTAKELSNAGERTTHSFLPASGYELWGLESACRWIFPQPMGQGSTLLSIWGTIPMGFWSETL